MIQPTRHADYYRLSARNRVFIARRRLPAAARRSCYLAVWTVLTLGRGHAGVPRCVESWRGAVEGMRADAGPRRPMSWRTVWRMTRAGRPPLI